MPKLPSHSRDRSAPGWCLPKSQTRLPFFAARPPLSWNISRRLPFRAGPRSALAGYSVRGRGGRGGRPSRAGAVRFPPRCSTVAAAPRNTPVPRGGRPRCGGGSRLQVVERGRAGGAAGRARPAGAACRRGAPSRYPANAPERAPSARPAAAPFGRGRAAHGGPERRPAAVRRPQARRPQARWGRHFAAADGRPRTHCGEGLRMHLGGCAAGRDHVSGASAAGAAWREGDASPIIDLISSTMWSISS